MHQSFYNILKRSLSLLLIDFKTLVPLQLAASLLVFSLTPSVKELSELTIYQLPSSFYLAVLLKFFIYLAIFWRLMTLKQGVPVRLLNCFEKSINASAKVFLSFLCLTGLFAILLPVVAFVLFMIFALLCNTIISLMLFFGGAQVG